MQHLSLRCGRSRGAGWVVWLVISYQHVGAARSSCLIGAHRSSYLLCVHQRRPSTTRRWCARGPATCPVRGRCLGRARAGLGVRHGEHAELPRCAVHGKSWKPCTDRVAGQVTRIAEQFRASPWRWQAMGRGGWGGVRDTGEANPPVQGAAQPSGKARTTCRLGRTSSLTLCAGCYGRRSCLVSSWQHGRQAGLGRQAERSPRRSAGADEASG